MLQITGNVQWVEGKLVRGSPKTEGSIRCVPLPPALVTALTEHRRQQEDERQGDDWEDHGYVFPSNKGTALNPYNLRRHYKAALKRAGLPPTTRFHDLRHTCASFLVAEGVHPRVVMEILGHSSIAVTMNTYSHVLPESQRSAAAQITALLEGAGEEEA